MVRIIPSFISLYVYLIKNVSINFVVHSKKYVFCRVPIFVRCAVFANVQISGSGAQTVSYSVGTACSCPGIQWLMSEADHSTLRARLCMTLYLHIPKMPSWCGVWEWDLSVPLNTPLHFSNTDTTSEPDFLTIFQLYIINYCSYYSLDLDWRKIYYLVNLHIYSLNRCKISNIHKPYAMCASSFGVKKKH
jgi:hypothetical protein